MCRMSNCYNSLNVFMNLHIYNASFVPDEKGLYVFVQLIQYLQGSRYSRKLSTVLELHDE